MNYYERAKKVLNNSIELINKDRIKYVKNPKRDFTRQRALDFTTMLDIIIGQTATSIKDDLIDFFNYDCTVPTTSAFVQQRDKIKAEAFEEVFKNFTGSFKTKSKYKGYRLHAIDGSDVAISIDVNNDENYHKSGYSSLHVNATYDVLNGIFTDAIIHPGVKYNEHQAGIDMVKRCPDKNKVIFIADRLYESYNVFEHINSDKHKYIIRAKDIHSNGILSGIKGLEDDEFDIDIKRTMTRTQTNHVKSNSDKYKFVPNNQRFDYLDRCLEYEVTFRVVRVKLDNGSYECLITNLSRNVFSKDDLKEIYSLRWGIELGFRDLKYSIGLNAFKSKKVECIKQEIWAKLTIHNMVRIVVSNIDIPSKDTKYEYKVNFVRAARLVKRCLKGNNKNALKNICELLKKELTPIRNGRQHVRNLKVKAFSGFCYRLV